MTSVCNTRFLSKYIFHAMYWFLVIEAPWQAVQTSIRWRVLRIEGGGLQTTPLKHRSTMR
jgi:hypothetical protein